MWRSAAARQHFTVCWQLSHVLADLALHHLAPATRTLTISPHPCPLTALQASAAWCWA
jgi:hypothetical protein